MNTFTTCKFYKKVLFGVLIITTLVIGLEILAHNLAMHALEEQRVSMETKHLIAEIRLENLKEIQLTKK